MDNEASFQASRKKPPPGKVIVVALLAIQGLFLIIIGLVAFFGGFVGASEVTVLGRCRAEQALLHV